MAIPGNLLSQVTESIDPNTSGWAPLLNCTLAKGTGGRNGGDGCLAIKSVAAGEMRARTASSYPVVAGTVYLAFADAGGGTVPERIGIRWLSASNAELSILWSLTTATAMAGWHRISVAGAAPVGAVRAQVVISSTPAAALVTTYAENIYLGLPIRTTGNLLSYAAESTEVSAGQWAAEVNATLGRSVPAVAWSVDNYLGGGHVLTVTATGAGNAAALCTERPSVTPGTEYLAYAYIGPPTLASDTWIELRFYDSNGNQIQATRSSLAAPGTGLYRQRVSAYAPTLAATCSVAVGINGASAAQVVRLETVVIMAAYVLQYGTVVPYADGSFEQGVAGWTKTAGVATLARSTPWGTYSLDGAYSLTVTSATATASTIRSAKFPLPSDSGGKGFRLMAGTQVTAGGWTATRGVRWYTAANTDLGLTASASGAIPGSGWWYLSNDLTAPATATQAAIEWTVTATAINSVLRMESVALWQALPLVAVTAVDATASITLTLRELTAGDLVTVWRVLGDGSRTLVRGPSGLMERVVLASDLLVVEDYEAPLGVPVSYYVEVRDALTDALLSTRSSDTVTITAGDASMAWLKDPGNPQRNMQVMVQQAPAWQRSVEQSTYHVKGRRNPVVLSGVRSGLEGELAVWTQSDDERAGLHWLLDSGRVLLWQAVPGMGVADMYVSVGQVTESRNGGTAMEPWRAWQLPLAEVDLPVTTGVNGSGGRTWVDVLAEYDTCTDLLAAYATCEDLLLDHRIGG
ncbi:hypothetical protein OG897_13690 [Streptomyces sp. NBC_00237]|uniref:hypothetical protein n=1 Tax=Streptomyces sp. NBC_00237 TaxID=2975687 RepID=UPI002256B82B|nr:hypothetical protein [Streptomyces sp. NBC_00237]MCX5202496.1 hypothetical protein [Streptomyces sp. NBC_00237]